MNTNTTKIHLFFQWQILHLIQINEPVNPKVVSWNASQFLIIEEVIIVIESNPIGASFHRIVRLTPNVTYRIVSAQG